MSSSLSTPLSRSTKWRFAAGSVGTGGFATLPGLVLIYYITDTLGISPLLAGLVVACAKVWDVFADPLIGGWSDRQLARTGSRRGLMIAGAIGLPVCFALTFAVPVGLPTWASLLWVMVAFLGAANFFSLFQVPYVALPAELTRSYKERTSLLSLRVMVLTVTILAFGAGGPALRGVFPESPALGYLTMGVMAGLVLGIGIAIATSIAPKHTPVAGGKAGSLGRSDSPRPDHATLPQTSAATSSAAIALSHYKAGIAALRDSQQFRMLLSVFMLQAFATGMMLGGAQYIATWILHDEDAVTILFVALIAPALIFAPLWKAVADRLGKKQTFILASAVFTVATIVASGMIWAPGWWIVAPVAVGGAAYAGIQTLPMAMIPDVITVEGARRSTAEHEDQAGTFSGVWTAGETIGLAAGSVFLAGVLAVSGYQETVAGELVTQPASAILGIALSFSVIPAVLMLISFLPLSRYRITEADVTAAR